MDNNNNSWKRSIWTIWIYKGPAQSGHRTQKKMNNLISHMTSLIPEPITAKAAFRIERELRNANGQLKHLDTNRYQVDVNGIRVMFHLDDRYPFAKSSIYWQEVALADCGVPFLPYKHDGHAPVLTMMQIALSVSVDVLQDLGASAQPPKPPTPELPALVTPDPPGAPR